MIWTCDASGSLPTGKVQVCRPARLESREVDLTAFETTEQMPLDSTEHVQSARPQEAQAGYGTGQMASRQGEMQP